MSLQPQVFPSKKDAIGGLPSASFALEIAAGAMKYIGTASHGSWLVGGPPPGGSPPEFKWQARLSIISVDGAGKGTITYDTPFTTGVLACFAWASGETITWVNATGSSTLANQQFVGSSVNTNVAVLWIAVGY